MRSLVLIPALVFALLLPATASARPLYDPEVSTPTPALAPPHDDSALGYVLVAFGGLVLGAAGVAVSQRGLRARAATPARPSPDPAR